MADPTRVRELVLALPGMAEHRARARLLASWPEIAGAAAARTRAERVEAGVLHVTVDGSGWLHRLTLEEAALLTRCRAIADVRAIRFHVASGPGPADPAAGAAGGRTP